MTTSFYNLVPYSRYNLSESESDIHFLVREFRDRINNALIKQTQKSPFISFAEKKLSFVDLGWLHDNQERFFKDTANENVIKLHFLSKCGFITCMAYSQDGEHIIVGHSSGLIQMRHGSTGSVMCTLRNIQFPPKPIYALEYSKTEDKICYAACMDGTIYRIEIPSVEIPTIGNILSKFISLVSADKGVKIGPFHGPIFLSGSRGINNVNADSGSIRPDELLNTAGNAVLFTNLSASTTDPPQYCIRVDPALECLSMQFFGAPGMANYASPFISQRSPALAFGLFAEGTRIVVGYGDSGIRVYDMETQELDLTYKVHKLRLQFIPKKLQRMHAGQVCAIKCHPTFPYMFASGAWDKTLRIWDIRCKVGCIMTFEGVDICSNSVDLNRNQCIAGSWKPTEALSVWDLVAKKRISIVRVQNRRPDVDGEYIYACRYWHSDNYNRKGKYAIIGGSGTNCVEVINLHNRYITCSYPAAGTVVAVASYQDRIAFGGTATTFNIVKFHDPKHEREKYRKEEESEYEYTKYVFDDNSSIERFESPSLTTVYPDPKSSHKSVTAATRSAISKTSAP